MKELLKNIVGADNVLADEPMSAHTTFKVGGPADYLVSPRSIEEVRDVIALCNSQSVPWMVIGNGSNLLVGDRGYRGVMIRTVENMQQIFVTGKTIVAQAGALLSAVARQALKHELAGMEFAAGIPGTIGGAMMMNAGAYGGEMKDIVSQVTILNENGQICQYTNEDMAFGYRDSVLAHDRLIALEITLGLEEGNRDEIAAIMNDLAGRRSSKQPLEYPSAGSTFKRPEGYFAGALIEQAGLKGYRIGGAMVSDKHCGFVINIDHATADDVRRLIEHVKKTVFENSGVELTPEVRLTGEF